MMPMDNVKQEELLLLMKKIDSFINRTERARKLVYRTQRASLQKARGILAEMGKKEERILRKVDAALKRHEKILEKMLIVTDAAEETLCNVFLAIRQNEYLQTYYPAQNGLSEQKVVGKYMNVPNKEKEVSE